MSSRSTVRLRQFDDRGRKHEFALHELSLLHELVHGERLEPETEVWFADRWIRLADHPAPVWLDRVAEQAIAAAERLDAVGTERFASKILRFSAGTLDEDRHEAVRLAKFLVGHLSLCAGRHREAVALLEAASSRRSRFSPAALNNLGVAWAHSRNPEAALRAMEAALAEDPEFLVARISLRDLARTLVDERAPTLPGRPSWAEIGRREDERLREASVAQVQALIDPRRPFPNYRLWHVFQRSRYCPEIGWQLVAAPFGQRAATLLLHEADQALNDAKSDRALVLAGAAVQFDAKTRPAADSLTAAATAHREEQRQLSRARRLQWWLDAFQHQLRDLTLSNLDAAREAQAVLSAYAEASTVNRLYAERIEELVVEALEASPSDTKDRVRLWTIGSQFATPEDTETYRRAALRCQVEPTLRSFWKAIAIGDLPVAAQFLSQAGTILGPADDLTNERTVLESLERNVAASQVGPDIQYQSRHE